jgi:hypothetical protein
MGCVVNAMPRPIYPQERPEFGWTPGPFWTRAENFAPIGIRFPDRPARSQSLYRLSYPGPHSSINGSVKYQKLTAAFKGYTL